MSIASKNLGHKIVDKVNEVTSRFDYRGFLTRVRPLEKYDRDDAFSYILIPDWVDEGRIPCLIRFNFDLIRGARIGIFEISKFSKDKEIEKALACHKMITDLCNKLNRETALLRFCLKKMLEEEDPERYKKRV